MFQDMYKKLKMSLVENIKQERTSKVSAEAEKTEKPKTKMGIIYVVVLVLIFGGILYYSGVFSNEGQRSRVSSNSTSSTTTQPAQSVQNTSNTENQPMKTKTEEASEYYSAGEKAYKEKNYQKAFENFTKAAELGNREAQFYLAGMYYEGEGVKQDYEQAEYWLKKSLEHGSESVKKDAQKLLDRIRAEEAKKSQTSTISTASTQPKPVQSKSVQSLSEPNNFDEAKGNASKFLVSIHDIAEKLMKTEAYKTFQDIENNGDETLYMRSWYNDRYFMLCYDNTRQRPTANPVATFRTYSPEFTFAGGIKVGSSFSEMPDFFGDFSSWNAEDNTLTVSEGTDEANIHITNDKIDYIEYNNLFTEYTHKMSNLLCLYRGDIYSAFITANGRLNVRDANGTHGNILFQVTKQNNILLVDTSPKRDSNGNRWYRVRFVYDKSAKTISSVNEGYVMGKYINVEPLGYEDRQSLITAFNK